MDFAIQKNDFYDSSTEVASWYSEATIDNVVSSNHFYNNEYGNSAWGDNDIKYDINCFESTDELDIEVYNNASINGQQGDDQNSAGNCFETSARIGTGTDSEFFEYFTKDGFSVPQSCKNPGSGNFYKLQSVDEASNTDCGTQVNFIGPIPSRYRDCTAYNTADVVIMITYLKNEIIRIKNLVSMNPWLKNGLLQNTNGVWIV
ncbi:MAG: hypothetical protein IPO92_13610 [Saprospiraceae bacterium]|nr:hypothetical protein [Saprospiraceae bacterium]